MANNFKAPYTHRYPPVGECIYCGSKNGLTKEHIIPKGLGGTLVLPESSCSSCSEITSKFERKVLRGFMHKGRIASGMPSYRKKKQPTSFITKLIAPDKSIFEKEFLIHETLSVLHLPILARPAFMDKRLFSDGLQIARTETIHFGKNVEKLLSDNDAIGARFEDSIDTFAFTRLLAKIAYGYLVATKGLFPRDESPLLPLIFKERTDASNWLGSMDMDIKTETNHLHLLDTSDVTDGTGRKADVVIIKLFSAHGAVSYYVAAARLPDWQSFAIERSN
ncbi:MAG: HNH endonuclease [Methylococcaceae bacterium]